MDIQYDTIDLVNSAFFGMKIGDIARCLLFLIMITMGLTLMLDDFRRVAKIPRAVIFGVTSQIIALPIVGFILSLLIADDPAIAIGVIILATCPGAATSNFFTYLANGDVALSITLTAVSSVVAVFTTPPLINLGLYLHTGTEGDIYLPIAPTMAQMFLLTIVPLSIGMIIRALAPALASRVQPMATGIIFILILGLIAFIMTVIGSRFWDMLARGWHVTTGLIIIMMTFGYVGAYLLSLNKHQARTLTIEIGIQNYTLAVVIAVSMLGRAEYVVVPAIYLAGMYVGAFLVVSHSRLVDARS